MGCRFDDEERNQATMYFTFMYDAVVSYVESWWHAMSRVACT